MILNTLPQDASLESFLHARAVAARPRRLALDVTVGALVAAAAAWARPAGWITLASAGFCFAMYGLWAIAERRLEDEEAELGEVPELALTVLRAGAARGGVIGALTLLFSAVAAMLGTWIS